MPRINLTDEEVAHIEVFRHRNAQRLAWNEAVDACREVIRAVIVSPNPIDPVAVDQTLQSLRKGLQ